MATEPNLFAVFGPDGKRASGVFEAKTSAWFFARLPDGMEPKEARRAGYTCREVRIFPVEEVGK